MSKGKHGRSGASGSRRKNGYIGNFGILTVSMTLTLVGILLWGVATRACTPDYEMLMGKNAVIQSCEERSTNRARYYLVTTTDGAEFHISGSYQAAELEAALKPGTPVSLKWYDRESSEIHYLEEVVANGKRVVTYTDTSETDQRFFSILGGVLIALGAVGVLSYFYLSSRGKYAF